MLRDHAPHRRDDMIKFQTAAVASRPENVGANLNLASGLLHARRFSAAIENFKNTIDLAPDYEQAYIGLAMTYTKLQMHDLAEESILHALNLNPDSTDAFSAHGSILAEQGRFAEAIEQNQKAVEMDPTSFVFSANLAYAWLLKAGASQSDKDLETAEQYLKQAIELDPGIGRAYLTYGLLEQSKAQRTTDSEHQRLHYLNSVEHFERALKLNPELVYAQIAQLVSMAKTGKSELAIDNAERICGDPLLTAIEIQQVARFYRFVEEIDRSNDLLMRATKAIGNSNPVLYEIAREFYTNQAYKDCIRTLKALENHNLDQSDYLMLMGSALLKDGDNETARDSFQRLTKLNDQNPWTWQQLAKTYVQMQLYREAGNAFEKAIKLDSGNANLFYNLGNQLLRQKKYLESIVAYEEVLKLKPNYLMALRNMAEAKRQIGSFDSALVILLKTRELGGEDWPYTTDQHIETLRGAIELKRRIPEFVSGELKLVGNTEQLEFAKVCQMSGKHETALEVFSDIIEESGKDSEFVTSNSLHYYAACSAIMAAREMENRAIPTDPADVARFRSQAFQLINYELTQKTQAAADYPGNEKQLALYFRQWQTDPYLANVRNDSELAGIDERAAKQWRLFWVRIETTINLNLPY